MEVYTGNNTKIVLNWELEKIEKAMEDVGCIYIYIYVIGIAWGYTGVVA